MADPDYDLIWNAIHDGLDNGRCPHGTQDPEPCIGCAAAAVLSAGRKQAAAEVAEDIAAAIETHHARDNLTARQCARIARHHATQYGTEETP